MGGNVNSAIGIPCKLQTNFFILWLTFLTPLHKLTKGVIQIAAELLKHRYELSKSIKDDKILDKYLMTNIDVRNSVMEACNISLSNYHVGIGKLKKAKFFIDGGVNPKFIPKLTEGADSYGLMIIFNFQKDNVEKRDIQESGTKE